MKIAVVLYSNDAETVWNALRFCNFSLKEGDEVSIFLMGKGVEWEDIGNEKFDIKKQMDMFVENGGKVYACGTCLKLRDKEGNELCPVSSLQDLYNLVKECDKVLTF